MTLGKKLSNYRKIASLTQQQLAEHLNISAQAISKWENDLSEPDLATLKALAKLYNTTVDALLDIEEDLPSKQVIDTEAVATSVYEKIGEQLKNDAQPQPIGFCKNCGITVNEENVAQTDPYIICKKCKDRLEKENEERISKQKETAKKIRELEEHIQRDAENKKAMMHNANMNSMRTHRLKSIIWGLVAAIPILVILLVSGVQEAQSVLSYIGSSIFTSYVIFAFVFTMFYDTFVKDAVLGMLGKTVSWPGLIFTFDLDGILWLIGMKLLFAVLGFIIGVLAAILGILFGMILSVFACPIILISYSVKIARGKYQDPELE